MFHLCKKAAEIFSIFYRRNGASSSCSAIYQDISSFSSQEVSSTMNLPRMQEYWFIPWFPMPESNNSVYGKKRNDLPEDAKVHYWYGYWTLDELYQYGALPAIEPK